MVCLGAAGPVAARYASFVKTLLQMNVSPAQVRDGPCATGVRGSRSDAQSASAQLVYRPSVSLFHAGPTGVVAGAGFATSMPFI